MVLERDPTTGSHTFTAPVRPYIPPSDAFGRTAGLGATSAKPPLPMSFSAPARINTKEAQSLLGYEAYSFSVTIGDIRSTWAQQGETPNFAETDMVGWGQNDAGHPFAVKQTDTVNGDWITSPDAVILGRMTWVSYKGRTYATMALIDGTAAKAPILFGETSAANPAMTEVTSYAPNAGSKQVLCMTIVNVNGTSYVWVGYNAATGAALGVEAFTDFTAAPVQVDVSNGHTGAASSVSGIIQAPNGDILLATVDGDLRLATNNTAAPAAVSFTTIQTQALGYFPVAIGNCALSNYAPGALWWCGNLNDSGGLFFANENYADLTPQGHLVLTSYDGLTLDPIDFPDLDFVTFATIYRGGPAACDRKSHYWYTGKRMASMDGGADRPVDSHKTRLCCGHAVVNDRFVIAEVEIDDRFIAASPNSDYNTTLQYVEYDPYRENMRPISKKIDLGFGGSSIIVGAAPSMPFSPETRNLHSFGIWEGLATTRGQDFGTWYRQYQAPANSKGSAQRSTDAPTVGGQEFDTPATWLSPEFKHPELKGFEYTPIRLIGPAVEEIQKGGPGAYVSVNCGGYLDSDAAPQKLLESATEGKYPILEFGTWTNRTWNTSLQLEVISHQGPGYTHWSANILPVTLEVIARRPLPRQLKL